MVDCAGSREWEEDVNGKSTEVCQYLALEPDGCDYQHERELRGVTGGDGHCSAMGNYAKEDCSGRSFIRSRGSFQDLSFHLRAIYYLVVGR